mmetsp:Transcript_18599/g.17694  ORF Transcript_18599/g.17694 Transcript_18599/m.17694 type:complete len:219 (-) Transcript_18599:3055-3711(-)
MFEELVDDKFDVSKIDQSVSYKVYENYILPAFIKLKNDSVRDQYVQQVFVGYLPLLAQIGQKFLELTVQIRENQMKKQQEKSIQEFYMMHEEEKWDDRNINQSQLRGRGTIILREEEQDALHIQGGAFGAGEGHINYEGEYDKLRRVILSIINDILSETEHTLLMTNYYPHQILFKQIGKLSVFLGQKMSIDNLIPLLNSCFNKKDFMLRRECLKGIP